MDYTYYEYPSEPLVMEEIIEHYADSWDDQWKTIAQEVVDQYLAIENKMESELTEDDIWVLDGVVFGKLESQFSQ